MRPARIFFLFNCQTPEGKAIAKQNPDFKEGRPKKYSKKQVEHAIGLLDNHSYKQVEDLTGISKSTLIRAKKLEKELEKSEHVCWYDIDN